MSRPRWKIAYLVNHPIQCQAPFLRILDKEPDIDFRVFFRRGMIEESFVRPGYGIGFRWDVPLLDGYRSEVLPHAFPANPLGYLREFLYWRRKTREEKFDFFWIHAYSPVISWFAALGARSAGAKILLRSVSILESGRSGWHRLANRLVLPWIFASFHGLFDIGTENRRFYRHYGVPEEKLFRMPYALDNEFFQERARASAPATPALRQEFKLEGDRPVAIFLSRMIERKRGRELLDAFLRIESRWPIERRPYLLFVGVGPELDSLKARVRESGSDSVRFAGFRNQTEIPAFYAASDLFVLVSRDEPWGLVVNEAMNCGLAVLASDRVGCHPDLVRPGETGWVVPVDDEAALERALCEAFDDLPRTRQMGQAALRLVSSWNYAEALKGFRAALEALG